MRRAPDFDPYQGDKPATNESRNFAPQRDANLGGGAMDRDTLLLRVSLIWLAIVKVGCLYMLFTL